MIPFAAVSTPIQNEPADRSSGGPGVDGGRATLRAALAVGLVSAWMVALFVGWVAWGLTHLLLAAALVAFPWHVALGGRTEAPVASTTDQDGESEESR